MRRDPDLLREILSWIEENCDGFQSIPLEMEGPDETQVAGHVELLEDEGLIEGLVGGCVSKHTKGISAIKVRRLTAAGHDFLDAARDDTRWNQAKGVCEKAGGWTVGILQQVLVGLLTQAAQDQMGD